MTLLACQDSGVIRLNRDIAIDAGGGECWTPVPSKIRCRLAQEVVVRQPAWLCEARHSVWVRSSPLSSRSSGWMEFYSQDVIIVVLLLQELLDGDAVFPAQVIAGKNCSLHDQEQSLNC